MYGSKATSTITISSGNASLICLIALVRKLFSFKASKPAASFFDSSITGKTATDLMPKETNSSNSLFKTSNPNLLISGIESIFSEPVKFSLIKIGWIKSSTDKFTSATMDLNPGLDLVLLSLVKGNFLFKFIFFKFGV